MSKLQVELQEIMGGDRSIAECAWTSSSTLQTKAKRSNKDVERIVTQLAMDGHGVPFESVIMRFWLRLPIMMDRHVMTHRIMSANGMSSRYRTMPDDFYPIPPDVIEILNKVCPSYAPLVEQKYNALCEEANSFYRKILANAKDSEDKNRLTNDEYKRVREVIRGVLPQANMTERVITLNLRSFANFQKLRNSPHAQKEIRQIAQAMLDCVKQQQVAPVAIRELEKKGWQI